MSISRCLLLLLLLPFALVFPNSAHAQLVERDVDFQTHLDTLRSIAEWGTRAPGQVFRLEKSYSEDEMLLRYVVRLLDGEAIDITFHVGGSNRYSRGMRTPGSILNELRETRESLIAKAQTIYREELVAFEQQFRQQVFAIAKRVNGEMPDDMNSSLEVAFSDDGALSLSTRGVVRRSERELPSVRRANAMLQQGTAEIKTLHGDRKSQVDELKSKLDVRYEKINAWFYSERVQMLRDSFLSLDSKNQLKHDYKLMVMDGIEPWRPLAQAIQEQRTGKRGSLTMALQFIQAIPYKFEASNDWRSSHDSSLVHPGALLMRNAGDCDAKALALAALLYHLRPELSSVLVVTGNHALLGVDIPRRTSDYYVPYRGKEYVLLEAAGPGLYPVGKISDLALNQLRSSGLEIAPLFSPEDEDNF